MSKSAVILKKIDEDQEAIYEGAVWDFIKGLFDVQIGPGKETVYVPLDPKLVKLKDELKLSKESLIKDLDGGIDAIFELQRLVKSGEFMDAAKYAKSSVKKLDNLKDVFQKFEVIEQAIESEIVQSKERFVNDMSGSSESPRTTETGETETPAERRARLRAERNAAR